MKKIVLFLAVILMAYSSYAQKIEVCNTCPISTLKKAIAVAKDYDTIFVNKGTYKEHSIIVDKPLTIIGKNYPVIDGEKKGEIITVTSGYVTVDGLFIINVGTSYTADYAAIRIKRSKHFTVRNLVLEKLFFGIYLERSSYGKIYHNKIVGDAVQEYNSGNGIQLWYSNNIVIEHNYIEHVRDGIYLEFSDNCLIKNNVSEQNIRYGLHFMFSNDDEYRDNTFQNNGAGVAVMF